MKHQKTILDNPHFAENLRSIFESKPEYKKSSSPEEQLYDGFLNDRDALRVEAVRNASERELVDFHPEFSDERLDPLLLHYKARSFPKVLSEDEMKLWEEWRTERLQAQLPKYLASLQRHAATADDDQQFVLQELQLWMEAIIPESD